MSNCGKTKRVKATALKISKKLIGWRSEIFSFFFKLKYFSKYYKNSSISVKVRLKYF